MPIHMEHPSVETGAVWEARQRIAPFISRTPLVYSSALSEQAGGPVYLKLEQLQPVGSFKLRGAANKILRLNEEQRKRGVTTFSTGNHGLAVAWFARRLGIRAVICLSDRVPQEKTDRISALGAELVVCGDSQDEAESHCVQLEQREGLTVIPPFDDTDIIAGQGTIGLELLEEKPDLGTVVIPLSGGGLFAGIASTIKSNHPGTRMVGVTMEGSAVMYHSLRQGKPIVMKESNTLADSLLGGIGLENRYTFQLVRKTADETLLVTENDIKDGLSLLFHQHKLLLEGAAATGAAAILKGLIRSDGRPIVLIISGCNANPADVLRAIGYQATLDV
ncbi:hydroxyectoine utilization dehydratase EutB [Desmospora activa]|uniref:threonine ammonia-lyase n=1 Tax=Desmospora activa DSM 45169 TaxID=1121389 RepID=A0A2T4Z218_9BACL|nr:hydroxyectoine utilization dehydratase EutB [Desmospora activa]PTM54819.1 threonine dehydratase [Desmospora activa DSM 45169]